MHTLGIIVFLESILSLTPAELNTVSENSWQQLLTAWHQTHFQTKEPARKHLEAARIQLEPWWCVGPFRNDHLAVVSKEFETVLQAEKEVLANGRNATKMSEVYQSRKLPGDLNTLRSWVHHPNWVDGFMHWLPRGPKPGRNETYYLYRTLKAAKPVKVDFILRSDCEAARVWLNGTVIPGPGDGVRQSFSYYGFSRAPFTRSWAVSLEAGDNRLLIKLTGMSNLKGFAFAIPGLTPLGPSEQALQAVIDSTSDRFMPGTQPWISEKRRLREQSVSDGTRDPPYYSKQSKWQDTLLACLTRAWKPGNATAKEISLSDYDRLWALLERDFPDVCSRWEMHWERRDGIWARETSAGPDLATVPEREQLSRRYTNAIISLLRPGLLSPTR